MIKGIYSIIETRACKYNRKITKREMIGQKSCLKF
uniref:Uncharacterized protein n=1 Tax=Rhizophora mucronata TaxID=61149 RepID=A0A2P2KMY4_RHIMU